MIQHSTYASKYPPGQGLGSRWARSWAATRSSASGSVRLSPAPRCAGCCSRGFRPAGRWREALLTALHPLVIEWSQSYWGGFRRARRRGIGPRCARPTPPDLWPLSGVMMALGMAVLANSRPYEGAVLCILVVGALLWHRLRRRDPIRLSASTLAAFLIVLLPALAALGFYNLRVTGHPFRLPYQVHEATYGITPLFIWQRPRPEPPIGMRCFATFTWIWKRWPTGSRSQSRIGCPRPGGSIPSWPSFTFRPHFGIWYSRFWSSRSRE